MNIKETLQSREPLADHSAKLRDSHSLECNLFLCSLVRKFTECHLSRRIKPRCIGSRVCCGMVMRYWTMHGKGVHGNPGGAWTDRGICSSRHTSSNVSSNISAPVQRQKNLKGSKWECTMAGLRSNKDSIILWTFQFISTVHCPPRPLRALEIKVGIVTYVITARARMTYHSWIL